MIKTTAQPLPFSVCLKSFFRMLKTTHLKYCFDFNLKTIIKKICEKFCVPRILYIVGYFRIVSECCSYSVILCYHMFYGSLCYFNILSQPYFLCTYHDTIGPRYQSCQEAFFHIQLTSFSFCLTITYNMLLKSKQEHEKTTHERLRLENKIHDLQSQLDAANQVTAIIIRFSVDS